MAKKEEKRFTFRMPWDVRGQKKPHVWNSADISVTVPGENVEDARAILQAALQGLIELQVAGDAVPPLELEIVNLREDKGKIEVRAFLDVLRLPEPGQHVVRDDKNVFSIEKVEWVSFNYLSLLLVRVRGKVPLSTGEMLVVESRKATALRLRAEEE